MEYLTLYARDFCVYPRRGVIFALRAVWKGPGRKTPT
jgi:hypothetical protein